MYFFFFKQKTAYEMRISDWSSDVCSSDLDPRGARPRRRGEHGLRAEPRRRERGPHRQPQHGAQHPPLGPVQHGARPDVLPPRGAAALLPEIGRASCRERVCQYVKIQVAAGTIKKIQKTNRHTADL